MSLLLRKANRVILEFFTGIFIFATMVFGGIFGTMSASVAETYNITLELENVSALPSEYTQLEYVQTTGTQYINTGIAPNMSTKWVLDAELMQNALNGVVNHGNSTDGYWRFDIGARSGGGLRLNLGQTVLVNDSDDFLNQRNTYVIDAPNMKWSYGSTEGTYTNTPGVPTTTYTVLIGARHTGSNGIEAYNQIKIYSSQLYNNGTIVQNLIPAKRNSDNVLGMYDTVTNTFKTNAGTGTFTAGNPVLGSTTSTYTVGVGATIDSSDAPARDGYTFAGWCTDAELTNCAMTQTIGTSDTGDKTFYAKYTVNTYNVTYSCGDADGTAPSGTTVTYGESFTPAANPCSKTEHTFAGWAVSDTNDVKPAGTAFTWNYAGDKTLTAQLNLNVYTISYTMNSGTNYSGAPTSYTYGTGATISGTPTRTGYTFAGWCTDSGLTSCAMSQTISTTDTGNKAFYAKWTPNVYTISYTMNGGTNYANAPTQYTYGTTTYINGTPTKDGNTFLGWCTDSGLTSCAMSQTISSTATGNKTFYAKWGVPVTVTYSCGDGTGDAPASGTATTNTKFTPAANTCTKQGYYFAGWKVEGTSTYIGGNGITWSYAENKTLTAQWFQEKFSATTISLSANTTVYFTLSAIGTFYVDWGDGSGETIVRTGTSNTAYSHKYTTAGVKTIRFGGRATGYNTSTSTAAISFYYSSSASYSLSYKIASVTGSLSEIFPYITDNAQTGAQPRFYYTFYNATKLTTVPDTLFKDYTTGASYMFYYTFYYCTGLTSIPAGLFNRITTSATHMFDATFYYCSKLASLPMEGLFSGITNASSYLFNYTFRNCSKLAGYIPPNTFARLTAAGHPTATNMFYYTFNSTALVSNCATYDPTYEQYLTGYEGSSYTSYYLGGKVSCKPSAPVAITLDTTNADTAADPSTIYLKYNTGWYSDSAGTTSISSLTTVPTKSGLTFAGFYTGENGAGTKIIDEYGDILPNNLTFSNTATTLYAHFLSSYTVTYSCGTGATGDAPSNGIAFSGESFTPADNNTCAKTGYTFNGWNDGTTDRPAGTAFTWNYNEDKTFTAQWTPATYDITLNNVSEVPSGYTQLEYLESTGTQYIDTGIAPGADTKWVLDNEFTATGSANGAYNSNLDGVQQCDSEFRFYITLGSTALALSYGPQNTVNASPSQLVNQRMTYIVDAPNMEWAYGNTEGSLPSYVNNCSVAKSLYIFARRGTYDPESFARQKTYSSRIYKNDVLVQELIPARRNSDNVLGMYDTVTNTFKTNAGTGTFTAGNPTTGSTTSTYTYGVGATINEVPTRDGYVFAGWCTDSALTNCAMTQTIGTSDTGDKTYYAKWVETGSTAANIIYELNGGTNYSGAPTGYEYGTGATINGTPTKSGYTFAGWCTDSALTNCAMTQTIGTSDTGDKTFYAKWTEAAATTYNITLNNVSEVPSGYTQLEYLESTGTQYIDTGVHFLFGDEFFFDYTPVASYSNENKGYGAGSSSATNITGGGRQKSTGEVAMYVAAGHRYYSPSLSYSNTLGKHYTEHWSINGSTNTLDSTLIELGTNNTYTLSVSDLPTSFDSGANIYLFRDNRTDNANVAYPSKIRLYGTWLKRSNGEYAFNYIPARRNSDNVLGMYDTVTNTFKTNAGTGTFTAGNPVLGSTTSTYTVGVGATINEVPTRDGYVFAGWCTDSALTNCAMTQTIGTSDTGDKTFYAKWTKSTYDIYLENVSALPSGYTQLEYLQSTGTQYINTGIIPGSDTKWVLDNEFTSTPSSSNFYNGVYDGGISPAFRFDIGLSTSGLLLNYGPGNTVNSSVSSFVNQRKTYTVDALNMKWAYDNTEGNLPAYSPSGTTSRNIYIFARQASSTELYCKQKTYSSKIYKNNALVQNLIPARRNSDNVLGMYDTVTNTFKTNAGTGTFTAGNPTTGSTTSTYTVGVGATINEVPTRDGYVFAGWCTDSALTNCAMTQTIGTSDTGDKTYYAKWTEAAATTYTCSAGTYLRGSDATCQTCPAGSYCAGVSNVTSNGSDQGIASCSTATSGLYTNSVAGATSQDQCYRDCTTSDIAYSSAVTGVVYADLTNTCEVTTCSTGATLTASATLPDSSTAPSSYQYRSHTGLSQYTDNADNDLSNGEWKVLYTSGATQGTLWGNGSCNGTTGDNNGYTWNNDSSNWLRSSDTFTNSANGPSCWCQITGWTPSNGDKQSLVSDWVFRITYSYAYGYANGCASDCAELCGSYVRSKSSLRAALFGSVVASGSGSGPSTCEPNTYNVTYVMDDGTNYNNAPTSYEYGTGATINGTPTKSGYTFAGWCTDSALTNCAMTQTIGTSDTGDKTFYAKWTEAAATTYTCSAGTYLRGSDATCQTCPAGSYCAGVSNVTDNGSDQGIASCSTATSGLYTNSVAGATSQDQCYRDCTTSDIAYSSAVTGVVYADLTNTCEVTTCSTGATLTAPAASVTLPDSSTAPSSNQSRSHNGIDIYNADKDLSNGQWKVLYTSGATQGTLWGVASCNGTTGDNGTGTWTNDSSNWLRSSDTFTNSANGANCWCQITGWTPSNGDKQSLVSDWAFNSSLSSASNCASLCTNYCGGNVQYYSSLRAGLFGSVVASGNGSGPSTCEPNTYNVTYVMDDGTNYNNAPTSYEYGTGATINGTPTKSGYTFAGWCTDSALTNCAMTQTIGTSDTGDKTFYAKWTEAAATTYNITLNNVSEVPDGYTQLEYLTSSGTQYINTDIYFDLSKDFRIEGSVINPNSSYRKIIVGNYYDGSNSAYDTFYTLEFGGTSNNYPGYFRNYVRSSNSTTNLYSSSALPVNTLISYDSYYDATNRRITNTLDYNGITTTYNGNTITSNGTASYPMRFFLDHRSNPSAIAYPVSIGETKIYKAGTLVGDFIPARRNSDNVLGMYDTVTNTFKTNAGTGTFTAGNPVLGSTTSTYTVGVGATIDSSTAGTRDGYVFAGWCTDSTLETCAMTQTIGTSDTGDKTYYAKWSQCEACAATNASCELSVVNNACTYTTACNSGYGNIQNNGAYNASCSAVAQSTYNITLNNVSEVPSGYTQLEYLEGTGTQWLCTDIHPSVTMVSQIGVEMSAYTGYVIYGFYSGKTATYRLFNYNGSIYFDMNTDSTRLIGSNMFQNNVYYDLEIGNRYVKNLNTNTTLVSGSALSSFSWDAQNYNMCLFSSSGTDTIGNGKIYYVSVYDNDTLAYNYIPARRNSDNVLGMYDTVTNTFKTNAGTGTFTAGNPATGSTTSTYTVGVGATINEVPTRDGYTFAGWCTDSALTNCAMTQTIGTSDTGDKTFYAKWTEAAATTYTCSAGTYLRGSDATCQTCPAGSYCAGVSNVTDNGSDQGIASCSTATSGLYTNSATGATSQDQCYRDCTTSDIAYSSAVTGVVYADLTNTCEVTTCSTGATLTAPAASVTLPDSSTYPSSYQYRSHGDQGAVNNGLSNGEWKVLYTSGATQGTLWGAGSCNGTTGNNNKNKWNNNSSNWLRSSDTFTNSADGKNCWCQITGWTPSNGDKQSLVSDWVFNLAYSSASDCSSDCAYDCSYRVWNYSSLRAGLVGSVVASGNGSGSSTCEPNTYNVTYVMDDGTNYSGAPTSYEYGTGATINGTPTKSGYTFAGWCTDSALTSCAMTQTIGTSDTGDKTYYAKWEETVVTCSAGEYLPMNANSCVACTANSYCGGGDYTPSDSIDQGIVSCASGLFAPAGMWESAQCGRILHVGDGFVYLRATKKTSPSLHLDLDHDGVADYFGNMTTMDVPMSAGTERKLKVRYNNTTYSIYDDSVELSQYQN